MGGRWIMGKIGEGASQGTSIEDSWPETMGGIDCGSVGGDGAGESN